MNKNDKGGNNDQSKGKSHVVGINNHKDKIEKPLKQRQIKGKATFVCAGKSYHKRYLNSNCRHYFCC